MRQHRESALLVYGGFVLKALPYLLLDEEDGA